PGSNYRFSALFLVPIVWAPYLLRRKIHLHPFHYLLFALALLLHNLGAFGLYQKGVFGLSFDIYVHYYFGLVGALIVRRILEKTLALYGWKLWLVSVLLIMGMGAIHELIKYLSYLMLGEQRGMLKPHTGYEFDTQRDLLNNLLGSLTAMILAWLYHRFSTRGSKSEITSRVGNP